MATQETSNERDQLLSQLPGLTSAQLDTLQFDEAIQTIIQDTHKAILDQLQQGKIVDEQTTAFLSRFQVQESQPDAEPNPEVIPVTAVQYAWLEERFGSLMRTGHFLSSVDEINQVIEESGIDHNTLINLLKKGGKLPLSAVKLSSKLGSCGCLAILLVVLGVSLYAIKDLITAAGYMTEANLRAGEEIGKKEKPLEGAISGMERGSLAQSESMQRQAELGQQLEQIRRNFSLMTAIDSLEDTYETQLYMHTLNRMLFGLGESALRARDAQGDSPEVMARINVYTQAVFLFVRLQLQSQIEALEMQQNTSRWGRVNSTGALEHVSAEEAEISSRRSRRLDALRGARDFMDQFLVFFAQTSVVRSDDDSLPVARDYAAWNTEEREQERQLLMASLQQIPFEQLAIDTEGLLHRSADIQTVLRGVLLKDEYLDVRMLNAFVSSTETQTGVMYRLTENFQTDRSEFLQLKEALGQVTAVVPQAVRPQVLQEVERIILAERTRIMSAQSADRQRMIQNLEDHRELRAQFEAVKEHYHLDDSFVRAALKVCRWMVGNPLEGFERGGRHRREGRKNDAGNKKGVIKGPQKKVSPPPRHHRRQNR